MKPSPLAAAAHAAWNSCSELLKEVLEEERPIKLKRFTDRYNITRITSAALLGAGGVRRCADGYELVLDPADLEFPLGKRSVPANLIDELLLQASSRFTIAHEIAHLILLDASGELPGDALFERHEQAIERACNTLASIILMPRKALVARIHNHWNVAERLLFTLRGFGVSSQAFVRRLNLHDVSTVFDGFDGLVGYASSEEASGKIRVRACHIFGAASRDLFDGAIKVKHRSAKSEFRSLPGEYRMQAFKVLGHDLSLLNEKVKESVLAQADGNCELDIDFNSRKQARWALDWHSVPGGVLFALKMIAPIEDHLL